MEKIFETQEEITGYITGKVKGGFIATVDGLPCFMPSSQIDVRPLKRVDHLMNTPVKKLLQLELIRIGKMFVFQEELCLKKVKMLRSLRL